MFRCFTARHDARHGDIIAMPFDIIYADARRRR